MSTAPRRTSPFTRASFWVPLAIAVPGALFAWTLPEGRDAWLGYSLSTRLLTIAFAASVFAVLGSIVAFWRKEAAARYSLIVSLPALAVVLVVGHIAALGFLIFWARANRP